MKNAFDGRTRSGEFGRVGDRVPNSCLLRDYCRRCGTPIRVSEVTRDTYDINNDPVRLRIENLCENCGAFRKNNGWTYLTPAQKHGNKKILR